MFVLKKKMNDSEWGWFIREDAPYLPFDRNLLINGKNKYNKTKRLKKGLYDIPEETNIKRTYTKIIERLDRRYDFGNIFAGCLTCFGICTGLRFYIRYKY